MPLKSINRLLFCTLLTLTVSSGCNLIYKQNIQQGNALEQEDLDELYLGMNKRQVTFLLGSASIQDPFHQDRWDYVQTFSRRGGDIVQRTITLRFENDLLTEIVGVKDPDYPSASIDDDEMIKTIPYGSARSDTDPDGPDAPGMEAIREAEIEAQEDVNPDINPIGERETSDREYEADQEFRQDMDVLEQRPPGDVTSPDIDG